MQLAAGVSFGVKRPKTNRKWHRKRHTLAYSSLLAQHRIGNHTCRPQSPESPERCISGLAVESRWREVDLAVQSMDD